MDEQTTPKKVRRVGSIAFALVLIAAGVLLIVHQFVPQFDLLKILKFSPVILIALGIEMLVYCARPDVKVKFDWLAMLGTAFTLCVPARACMAGTAAVGQQRAGHVPPLPCGKRQTSGVRKAAPHPALRRHLPPRGKAGRYSCGYGGSSSSRFFFSGCRPSSLRPAKISSAAMTTFGMPVMMS